MPARGIESLATAKALEDLGKISLGATESSSPIYLSDIAAVRLGPDIRRGVADWNGQGETVGGIVVMRFGENARTTIENVRNKLADLEKGLPPGVAIDVGYDRGDLIDRAADTLKHTQIIADAAREVGPSLFFALLIIVVSFLPIFVLHHGTVDLPGDLLYCQEYIALQAVPGRCQTPQLLELNTFSAASRSFAKGRE